jgi:hypothetical protein
VIEGVPIRWPLASRHGIFFWSLRNLVKVRYTSDFARLEVLALKYGL